jgi:uncharacterized membrane protein YhaH (DUF805 family)
VLALLSGTYSNNSSSGAAAGVLFVYFLFWLVVAVLYIAGMWKAFEKAGHPGWAAIIPIYNVYIITKIVGREPWWVILAIIPCVSFVVWIVLSIDVAKSYGKDTAYGIGLWLLGFVFWPMLGFGQAQYVGPSYTPAS